ncbi:MAG: TonB-dependent receptor [Pseudomonadota bacterium]
MNFRTKKEPRRGLLMQASVFALASTGFMFSAAAAQDAEVETIDPREEVEDSESTDTIVVTGSRIRREVDTTIDVTTIDSIEIQNRGFVNAIEAVEQLPLTGIGVNNQGANVQRGDNSAFPDLLNLGTQRTLSLVNGRRFVGANQATVFVPGNANGVQVDLTVINPALIDRTEVQTVGSGPIYGADAVAGVVNIILKDDYEGAEFTLQGGLTQEGDGGNYRATGVWGKNFFDGRANLTLSAEYLNQDLISSNLGGDRVDDQGLDIFQNPLAAAPGTPTSIRLPGVTNPLIPTGGLLTSALQLGAGTATPFFPSSPVANFTSATFNPNNLSPFDFAQTAEGQAINPLLFVGTFAPSGTFVTVPNPDAATASFLPRLAVPLQFGANGDLTPFNIGNILPPNPAEQNRVIGGDGFPNDTFTNIQSAQERISFNMLGRYDFSDNLRIKQEFLFSDISNDSIGNPPTNSAAGDFTGGTLSVPIFVDQNPLLTANSLATINSLAGQGLTFGDIGGERVLFLSRSLRDITGPNNSGNDQRTYRTATTLEGEFDTFDRSFFWDVSFIYGLSTSDNFAEDILDVEFALAADVVDDGNGNAVCRQQTLDAPEPIGVRNPGVAFINSGLPAPVTPTQAQIDACVPLNLFGFGAPSQAAIDYVTGSNLSTNKSQQFYGAASFGGEIVELPAGPLQFNSQFEWRRETNEFTPGPVFSTGTGRNTLGQASQGALRFFEGGTEFIAPIFGDDFSTFAMNRLELNGAVRVVNRSISSELNPLAEDAEPTTNVTFTGGGRWSPFEGITFRGNRTRAVRSASVVELVGAGVTGFTGGGDSDFACDVDNIDGGPAGGIRRSNCEAFVQSLGLPLSFLDDFNIPGGTARPAAGASNPFLENEIADNWTVGVVLQPSFIPGLTIESDYFAVDLDGTIALTFQVNACYDDPAFPDTQVGGFPACDLGIPNIEDPNNPGSFIVPTINPITGNPVPAVANPGIPAAQQAPGNLAFIFFPTINVGRTEIRSLNNTINYQFDLADALGARAEKWGSIAAQGTVYFVDRFDVFPSGTTANPSAGEPANPKFQTRFDLTHQIGDLTHTLQWFRTSSTVNNVLIDEADIPEQADTFVRPDFNTFNYNVRYDFTENVTGRLIVNNLTNAKVSDLLGTGDGGVLDTVGRRFIFSVTAKF